MSKTVFSLIVTLLFGAGVPALCSAQATPWSVGANVQVANLPLPTSALGVQISRSLISRTWWDVRAELAGMRATTVETHVVCLVGSNSACDGRNMGEIGQAELALVVGTSARRLYGEVGIGGYMSSWWHQSSATLGSSPRGRAEEVGVGTRWPVGANAVSVEVRARTYANTNLGDRSAFLLSVAYNW
jgi:hypothetical protein